MDNKAKAEPLWTGSFIMLMLIGMFNSFGFNIVSTTVSKHVVGMGFTASVAGVVAGAFSITSMVVRPFSGAAADRYDKRHIFMIAMGLVIPAIIGYMFADSLPVLIMCRILHGASYGACGTCAMALIGEMVPKSRLGEGMSLYTLGNLLAIAVAPSLGLFLYDNWGSRVSFGAVLVFAASSMTLMALLRYHKDPNAVRKEKKKISLRTLIAPEVIPFSLMCMMLSLTNGIVSSFLPLMADTRQIVNVGLFFTVYSVALAASKPVVGKLIDKWSLPKILIPTVSFAALAMVLIGSAYALPLLFIAAVCKALGQGSAQPALQTAAIRKVDPTCVGIAVSTMYIGSDIGQGVGPMIGGAISDLWGYGALFYTAAGATMAVMAAFLIWYRKKGCQLQK